MKRVLFATSGMAALLAASEETEAEKRAIIDTYDAREEDILVVAYTKIEPVPEYREPTIVDERARHPKNQTHPKRYRKGA